MKKVKITVLERTFQQEIVSEYAYETLEKCPAFQEGPVFYGSTKNRKAFVILLGDVFINMSLHWRMVGVAKDSFLVTGLRLPVQQSVAVMMD